MPTHTLNLPGILSETKRILNAHSRHFLLLSLLFLLPSSFSLIIFPSLFSPTQNDIVSSQLFFIKPNTLLPQPHSQTLPFVIFSFIFTSFICATLTITYSTFHGFYGRPVKTAPALKLILIKFLPLVSTIFAAALIMFLIVLTHVLFFIVCVRLCEYLGFVIEFGSVLFYLTCGVLGGSLALLVTTFKVNWCLASVVVVTEGKWGFAPLWRSAYLVKGMRGVSLSVFLLFGCLVGVWVWLNSYDVFGVGFVEGWKSWSFVLQLVVGTSVLTLFLLYDVAANTVLYMYCKALHGELAIEIAEEFAREYVSLPFDDEKLPHVVTVYVA